MKITYDAEQAQVIRCEGIEENSSQIEVSNHKVLSMPIFITVNHIPFYPSKYEFIKEGEIVYASQIVPDQQMIKIVDDNFLNERAKTKQNTITFKDLESYNKKRKRIPSQNQVMGESAKEHAEFLVKKGVLEIESQEPVSWHWCHLIAFSLLPTEKAQKKANLVCGTAACNGHMANIEAAIKRFIYEFKRPLGLKVTATTYAGSHLARRIGYQIFDKEGSKCSHSEYFDALTDVKTDVAEYEPIYKRMLEIFNEIIT